MAQDPKVVPIKPMIDKTAAPASESAQQSSLPYPMQAVRKRALGFFKVSLSRLFDNTDDSLFELAGRAATNAEQNLYFDTLRNIRLERERIISDCCNGLAQRLEKLNLPVTPETFAGYHLDTLSLVQPDELEQTVAVESMVKRVAERNDEPLAQLATRINSMVKRQVEAGDNPLAPAVLADIFIDAVTPLDMDIRVRLIMFKLFERYVFNPVDELYQQANELLAEAGVLPDLGAAGRRRSVVRPSRGDSGAVGGEGRLTGASREEGIAEHQVLGLFSSLLGKWREASGDAAMSLLDASSARSIASDELLDLLADMPMQTQGQSGQTVAALRGQIQQHLQHRQQMTGHRHSLERGDDDVISLVSMLFDFILDDPQLPVALKALIARMQLPILRVAISDKAMFSHSGHPARRLLNELARAAMGWNDQDDPGRDQLYAVLEGQVQRLLEEAHPTAELFAGLHAELSERVQQEQRRAERIEQRTCDTEEGRARLEAARAAVAAEMNTMLLGKTLPVFVVDLLRNGWTQVMQAAWLREGSESDAWRSVCEVARRLLDSMTPLRTEADRELRVRLNAALLTALAKGFERIGMDLAERERLLDGMQELQQVLLATAPSDVRVPDVVAETLDDMAAGSEVGPAEPPAVSQVLQEVTIEAPLLEVPGQAAQAQTVEDLPSTAAQHWLTGLRAGSWFELTLEQGEPPIRCKLAAIISFSGKHVFVNRTGIKVAEYLSDDLTRLFDRGLIRQLDDNLLFDRALQSVIGNLRSLHEQRH